MRTLLAILAAWLLAVSPAAAQLMTLGAGPGGAAAGGGGGGLTFVAATSFVAAASSGSHAVTMTAAGTAAPGDVIIVSTVNNGGGAAFTLSNGSTPLTVTQFNGTQSDGALQYEIFAVPLGSGEISTASINYSGMTTGGDISIAIYHGGSTVTVDATNGWATAAAGNTLGWNGVSVGSNVGFVIATAGYSYNVANTLSGSPATWTFDVQNTSPDAFFGNYYAHSNNYTNTTQTFTGYGSQVKGGWLIGIAP